MNGIWGISGYPVLRHTCTHRTPLRCHIGAQKVRLQEWWLEGEPDFRVTAEGRGYLDRAPKAGQGGFEEADVGRGVQGEKPSGAEAERQEMKA